MSTKNINKIDSERGDRHKKFRKEHLSLTQEQLREVLKEKGIIDRSQSTISNYDRGSMPAEEVLLYYASEGMNLHWFFTGMEPMLYTEIAASHPTVAENSTNYSTLKGRLKFKFSKDNLAEFLQAMYGYREDYIGVLNSSSLSRDEREDLKARIIEGIKEKFTLIQ